MITITTTTILMGFETIEINLVYYSKRFLIHVSLGDGQIQAWTLK